MKSDESGINKFSSHYHREGDNSPNSQLDAIWQLIYRLKLTENFLQSQLLRLSGYN